MANPHGTPIWYELMSNDADASRAFYERVIGWTVHPAPPGGRDYRMVDTGRNDFVGGFLNMTDEMKTADAKPGWLFYIGVDDVDATVARIEEQGGGVIKPAFDNPGVGRLAFVHDPQGVPFYVMRGASPEDSRAYDRTGMGKCNWNELHTTDQAAANAFYADAFGWTYPNKMEMPGDLGDYVFIQAGDQQIGATMKRGPNDPPPGWRFYFRTPDIDAAAAQVTEAGGTVLMGPHEVPGGDRIIFATDPDGVMFGAVGPGTPGEGAQA